VGLVGARPVALVGKVVLVTSMAVADLDAPAGVLLVVEDVAAAEPVQTQLLDVGGAGSSHLGGADPVLQSLQQLAWLAAPVQSLDRSRCDAVHAAERTCDAFVDARGDDHGVFRRQQPGAGRTDAVAASRPGVHRHAEVFVLGGHPVPVKPS
jgi:hypothetical protein